MTAEQQRARRLRKNFKLSLDDYDRILQFQGGACAVCKNLPKNYRLSVDHDHKSGLVRGLLCWQCNRIIGFWRDHRQRFIDAADYIKNPPANSALGAPRYGKKGRAR